MFGKFTLPKLSEKNLIFLAFIFSIVEKGIGLFVWSIKLKVKNSCAIQA